MPPNLGDLKEKFREKEYLFSAHASDKAAQRGITSLEIEEAIENGEVIEDYPDDKYSPSCLIYGQTNSGKILHVLVSYPEITKIITVYEPNPDEWEAGKLRKQP